MTDEEEFAARSQLKWTREGDEWICSQLDEHARRLRSDAATMLADDALEAVDGILLFGVSAAYIFAVMQAYWSMLAARVTPAVTHPVTHISGECERQESRTTPQ